MIFRSISATPEATPTANSPSPTPVVVSPTPEVPLVSPTPIPDVSLTVTPGGEREEPEYVSLTVHKSLVLLQGEEPEDVGVRDAIYYVGLFEGNKLDIDDLVEVKEVRLESGFSASVVFEKLEVGKDYVVAELLKDEDGSYRIWEGDETFAPVFEESDTYFLLLPSVSEDVEASLFNEFYEWPSNFFLIGELTVAKELFDEGGQPLSGGRGEKFYVGLFEDGGLSLWASTGEGGLSLWASTGEGGRVKENVVTLDLSSKSSSEVTIPVYLYEKDRVDGVPQVMLYVSEVVMEGDTWVPVSQSDSFAFEVRYESETGERDEYGEQGEVEGQEEKGKEEKDQEEEEQGKQEEQGEQEEREEKESEREEEQQGETKQAEDYAMVVVSTDGNAFMKVINRRKEEEVSPTPEVSPMVNPSVVPSGVPSGVPSVLPTGAVSGTPTPKLSFAPKVSVTPIPSGMSLLSGTPLPSVTPKVTFRPMASATPTTSPGRSVSGGSQGSAGSGGASSGGSGGGSTGYGGSSSSNGSSNGSFTSTVAGDSSGGSSSSGRGQDSSLYDAGSFSWEDGEQSVPDTGDNSRIAFFANLLLLGVLVLVIGGTRRR